jgi:hypothetical protein
MSSADCDRWSLGQHERKNPDRGFDPGFGFYPAGAVQVILPFPFVKGG